MRRKDKNYARNYTRNYREFVGVLETPSFKSLFGSLEVEIGSEAEEKEEVLVMRTKKKQASRRVNKKKEDQVTHNATAEGLVGDNPEAGPIKLSIMFLKYGDNLRRGAFYTSKTKSGDDLEGSVYVTLKNSNVFFYF